MKKNLFLTGVFLLNFCFLNFIFAESIILKAGQKKEGETDEKTMILGVSPEESLKQAENATVYIQGYSFAPGNNPLAGTGFIVDSEGIILTNCHVISSSAYVIVELYNGEKFPIESILYYDIKKDFCILKINAKNKPSIQLSDSDKVEIGEKILFIGNAQGKKNVLSKGVISDKRDFSSGKYLETTAYLAPGNSGGPALNMHGKAIGVMTIQLSKGMILAINEVKPFLSKISRLSWPEFIQEKPIRSNSYFMRGVLAQEQGDLEGASDNYKRALQLYPDNLMAYYNLGDVYMQQNRINDAIECYRIAIKIEPLFVEAYNNLSVAYARNNDFEKTIEYAECALKIKPNHTPAYYNLALAYKKMGNKEKVKHYVNKLHELGESAMVAEIEEGN